MAIDTATYEATLEARIDAATATGTTTTEFLALSKAVEAIAAPGGVTDIQAAGTSQINSINALLEPTFVTASLGATATTYTLGLTDKSRILYCTNTAALTITIPLNSSVAFPTGSTIDIVQAAAGQITVAGASGVTLNSRGTAYKTSGQWAVVTIVKTGTDTWLMFGATVA